MDVAASIEREVAQPRSVAGAGLLLKLALAITPMALFLDPTSRFPIYSVTGFEDDVVGYPVSLMLLPFVAVSAIAHLTERSIVVLQFIVMLTALIAFSSIFFGTLEPIPYGSLWIMPFVWLLYFLTASLDLRSDALLRIFIYSVMVSTGYLCLAGTLEMLLYGGLLESGRMSSNLVLPGQYQLYVYMPTIIALSSLICVGALRSGVSVFRGALPLILALTAYALFLAAAREAILTFAVGLCAILLCTTRLRLFLFAVSCVLLLGLLVAFSDQLIAWAAASEYGAISKFAQVQDADQQFGSRDIAIAQYWEIFKHNPLIGTGFRSPFENYFGVPVNFPSAHNFYADTLAWTGVAGSTLIFGALIWFSAKAIMIFFDSLTMDRSIAPLARAFAAALLVALILSNNINVPMRQPLLAPIFGLLFYGAMFFRNPAQYAQQGR